VRELENALERALIIAGESEVLPDHLAPAWGQRARGPADLLVEGFELDAFERDLVHAALERAGGNKTNAAKLLGITRRRLYSLLASFGATETNEP
jgi:DNA-binding NtrC family response regulator